MTLTTAQQRRHAKLLRDRDPSPEAQAQAALIEARAELDDALADRPAEVASDARMVEELPLLGHVTREGGKMIALERPWTDEDVAATEAKGVDVRWEWRRDPMAGLRQGELSRIYIGTREGGPALCWDRDSRAWAVLRSRGDYGKNWACGGHWRADRARYTLTDALAQLDAATSAKITAALRIKQ